MSPGWPSFIVIILILVIHQLKFSCSIRRFSSSPKFSKGLEFVTYVYRLTSLDVISLELGLISEDPFVALW